MRIFGTQVRATQTSKGGLFTGRHGYKIKTYATFGVIKVICTELDRRKWYLLVLHRGYLSWPCSYISKSFTCE